MKIGRLSASVDVSKTIAMSAPSPRETERLREVGRMTMKKNSISGNLQLSDRMTRTTSQSTTRRGGSADPQRNRASAADRKAGSGWRQGPGMRGPGSAGG